jgi:N-acetyltransferase
MKLVARILENRFLALEPLGEKHREGLRAAAAGDEAFFYEQYPFSLAGEHFEPRWDQMMKDLELGTWIPFAVMQAGVCIGITCFITPDSANATVEVGGTYYRPDVRGGVVNPAAKRLMMGEAFECGARRVAYHVDGINKRSQAAVLKLGAVQEGIRRRDRVTWTGRVRDTVIFSVLADEWPKVRDGLDARLAVFG